MSGPGQGSQHILCRPLSPGRGKGAGGWGRGPGPSVSLEIPQGLSPKPQYPSLSAPKTQMAAFGRGSHSPPGAQRAEGVWSVSPELWDRPGSTLESPRAAEPRRGSQPTSPQVTGVQGTLADPAERQEESCVQEHLCVTAGPSGEQGEGCPGLPGHRDPGLGYRPHWPQLSSSENMGRWG